MALGRHDLRKVLSFITCLVGGALVSCAVQEIPGPAEVITTEVVDGHIRYLSSDALMGRDAFREEIQIAEAYIAEQFRAAGLSEFPEYPGFLNHFSQEVTNRRDPEAVPVTYELQNVVGFLEGTDPVLKNEYILFGAHHDHVGVRQPREEPPPGTPVDSIYNGAEDNATGTTAIIALAQYFAQTGTNKRSIIFATFTAEEKGLIGARHLAANLPVDANQLVCMINFEMIGKPASDGSYELLFLGGEYSTLDEILGAAVDPESPIDLVGPQEHQIRYFNGSDNVAFHREGFITTTLASPYSTDDPDYHQPTDHYELLNIDFMTKAIRAVVDMTEPLIAGEVTPEKTGDWGTQGG